MMTNRIKHREAGRLKGSGQRLFGTKHQEDYVSRDRRSLHMLALRVPGLAFIFMVYAASVSLQYIYESWTVLLLLLFTILIVIFAVLHWHSYRWVKKKTFLYFIIQGFIIYTSANLMTGGYIAAVIGLYAFLIGQIIGMADKGKTPLILYLFILMSIAALHQEHPHHLLRFIVIAAPIMIVIITYAATFFAQVDEKIKTQMTLEKLELAHRQVKQLTLQNERQRMARDLHDTLAQGLVSLHMQLEAVHVHLSKGNTDRAKDIISQSMDRVKGTLADARSAIDNLRSKSEEIGFLKESITEQINHFTEASGLSCFLDYSVHHVLDVHTAENCLYMIGEGLTNAAKHAEAKNVWVSVQEEEGQIRITVKDDGKGFDAGTEMRKSGHYGLLGIQERVNMMNGTFRITSAKSAGTQIEIIIPIQGEAEHV